MPALLPLDIALRATGAGLWLLTAAVLLLSAPRSAVARGFAPFAVGIAGFLAVNSAFDHAELPGLWWSVASFASRMAAVFLWLFCLLLFDGRPRRLRGVVAIVAAWLALVVVDKGYLAPPVDVSPLPVLFASALVLHAGWRVLRELRDDLVERRRRARPVVAAALLALLASDVAVDVLQGYGWRPATFVLLQNGAILGLGAVLGLWLLRAEPWLAAAPAPAATATLPATADPERAIVERVEAFMRTERPYLDPDLTFGGFARRLGVPEPALRRAINHGLGHGHFRAFLNGYRVDEARRRLRDPAHAADKILAIALDSGFSSLASFNRAFRQVAGCAPSEYRAGTAASANARTGAGGS